MIKNVLIVCLCLLLAASLGLWAVTGGSERLMAMFQGTTVEEQKVPEVTPEVDVPVQETSLKTVVRTLLASIQSVAEPIIEKEFAWTTGSDQILLVPGFQVRLVRLPAEVVEMVRTTLLAEGFTLSNANAADGPGASLSGYERGTHACRLFEVYTSEGETMWTDLTVSCGDTAKAVKDAVHTFLAQVVFATAVEFGAVEETDFVWWQTQGEEVTGKYITGYRMISPDLTPAGTPNFPQMFTDWGWTADQTNTVIGETSGMLGFTKDAMVCQLIGGVKQVDQEGNAALSTYTLYCGMDAERPVQRRAVTPEPSEEIIVE